MKDRVLEVVFAAILPILMGIYLIVSLMGMIAASKMPQSKEKTETLSRFFVTFVCCCGFFIWWRAFLKLPHDPGYGWLPAFFAAALALVCIWFAKVLHEWFSVPYWLIAVMYLGVLIAAV